MYDGREMTAKARQAARDRPCHLFEMAGARDSYLEAARRTTNLPQQRYLTPVPTSREMRRTIRSAQPSADVPVRDTHLRTERWEVLG